MEILLWLGISLLGFLGLALVGVIFLATAFGPILLLGQSLEKGWRIAVMYTAIAAVGAFLFFFPESMHDFDFGNIMNILGMTLMMGSFVGMLFARSEYRDHRRLM